MEIFNIIEDIETDNINNFFLLVSCEIGNIEMMEWILNSDYHIDINFENNLPFQIACQNNNIDIAKYIYKKTNNAIINDNYIIHNAFNNNYYELIKWLHSVNPQVFSFLTNDHLYGFLLETIYSNVDMAEWLLKSFPSIPLYVGNNYLFINCCSNNYLEEAQLLQRMKPNCFYINILDDEIVHYEILDVLTITNKIYNINAENCYICYDEMSDVYTSCNHFYCKPCIEMHYIRNDNRCPYCRKENNENDLSFIVINNNLGIK